MQRVSSIMMLVDLVIAALALVLGHIIHFGGIYSVNYVVGPAGTKLIAFMLLTVFSAYFCEMYRWEKTFGSLDLAARTAVSVMLAFFMLSAYYYLLPTAMVDRGVLSFSLLIFGGLQLLFHLGLMKLTQLPALARKVLILGVGPFAESVEKLLLDNPGSYVFAGFVCPKTDKRTVPDSKIIGDVNNLNALIEKEKINRLVVAVTEKRGGLPVQDLLRCKLNGVNVVDAASFYEDMTHKLRVEDIQPSWFIYSDGFRVSYFLNFMKRILDIVSSTCGIILLIPVWPLVALLVRIDSPGPIIFKQTRVGEHEAPFTIYKFRTMRQDAEKAGGAVWAVENDPRITKVGKFLRKTRLDEIPQLFNVVKGDMSLVGPRPERPEFVDQLNEKIPYYPSRHFMKPGVTGWAQICYPYGASDEDSMEKLRYDLYYIKNYTLFFDVIIVLETVKVVLFGRGGR